MHLRLSKNLLRFRITLEEMERLLTEGALGETTVFPGGLKLQYSIGILEHCRESSWSQSSGPALEYNETDLKVWIPRKELVELSKQSSNRENGIKFLVPVERSESLTVRVEIDLFQKGLRRVVG